MSASNGSFRKMSGSRASFRTALAVASLTALATLALVQAPAGATSASAATASVAAAAPSSPPANICGNAAVLNGPATPPSGAVVIQPGVQDVSTMTTLNPPGTTFWLAPGVHSMVASIYAQVIPKDGNTYIGAPGAILDGKSVNRYAFTQHATNVTIKHLFIRNFMAPGDEGVVNHDFGQGWVIEKNTIAFNGGAGALLGAGNRLVSNCLADNSQYGFQAFGANLTIDGNEVTRNNTYSWETMSPGCGCSGGAKFWGAGPGTVTNNYVHDNYNVGLWADTNVVGMLFEGNYISDNRSHGILYETSYNARIVNNTFRRNAIGLGHEFQARLDSFPVGAIYVSESGGDPRVNGGTYSTLEISGNNFEDNWAGVVLWENADRYCASAANTSTGYCTMVNPNATISTCGDPATGGLINTEPYKSDCRWKTQNVLVSNNDFSMNPANIGCTTNKCGVQAVFSNHGSVPHWSPYLGATVQQNITFNQNNHFVNNRYVGPWRFAAYEANGNYLSWDQWRAAPHNHDAGGSYNGAVSTTTTTPPTTTPQGPTQTIWPNSQTAQEVTNGMHYTLGTRFTVSAAGQITALRFYETPNMAETISLKLWRETGTTTAEEVAAATYNASSYTAGWRNAALVAPVQVVPGQRYVVSYHVTRRWGFAWANLLTARVSGNLTALANDLVNGIGNGVYKEEYGVHTYPGIRGDGHSYFADVVFTTSTSPTTTPPTTTPPTTVPPTTVPAAPPETLWPNTQTAQEVTNGMHYTLGTRFTVSAPGQVRSLRFYETPNMAEAITLKLWRETGPTTGVELASTTYNATSGVAAWRNADLGAVVPVVPGEKYVVSYHVTRRWAFSWAHFITARVSGHLTAPANDLLSGNSNGVYKEEYGTHTFPGGRSDGHSFFANVVYYAS